MLNVAEAQLNRRLLGEDGAPNAAGAVAGRLDTLFTCVFAAELAANAYAHWFWPFVSNRFGPARAGSVRPF